MVHQSPQARNTFTKQPRKYENSAADAVSGFPLSRGAMFIQAASRFEFFVRSEVEDLALRASNHAKKFSHLPKEMRDNLLRLSAMVLESPRKFRMASQVTNIVGTLARNLSGEDGPGEINHRCLSITSENMRASVIKDLFGRLGVKDIWQRIGQNAQVQVYLEMTDANQVSSACQSRLNQAMDRRNSFAHSGDSITWPSADELRALFAFLTELARAISSVIPVSELALKAVSDDIKARAGDVQAGADEAVVVELIDDHPVGS